MKTTVFCVTIFCLELASSFPFPEQLPSYYGSYEPVSVPGQGIISQPIQLSNLARSQNPDLSYQQQQLAYLQQEKARRQNYENLLRKQEQQQQVAALKQRLANQLLTPAQPEHNYNSPIPLNTVHDPYLNSISLQSTIKQPQYEAPITPQYYQNQHVNEPYQRVEPPQQYNVPNPEPQSAAGSSADQPNYSYNQKYHPGQNYNAHNVLYDPRIQQALASSPLKKRYLVLHPNGTIEHIDKIEHIVQRHPNYVLVNAGDLHKPNEVTPTVLNPLPGNSPGAQSRAGPVAPIAPLTPVAPPTPYSPVVLPSTPEVPPLARPATHLAPPGTLPPPPILNGRIPPRKPTVQPPTDPTTTPKSVTAPTTLAPPPFVTATATAVYPPTPVTTTPLPPTVTTGKPTVTPPSVVTATATAVYPPPGDTTSTPPATTVTCDPTATTPSGVTATATAAYPPPSDLKTTTPTPAETTVYPTVTPPPVVTATATAVYPPVTDPVTITKPVVNVTTTSKRSPEAKPSTNATAAASVDNQLDGVANSTVSEPANPTNLDLPFVPPSEPVVWFRTTDLNFWDKLTSGNETYDVVYFFNVLREPRVLKDTKTVIYANGTVVDEVTQTIYDDEDSPPRVIKTTKVTNPVETQPKT